MTRATVNVMCACVLACARADAYAQQHDTCWMSGMPAWSCCGNMFYCLNNSCVFSYVLFYVCSLQVVCVLFRFRWRGRAFAAGGRVLRRPGRRAAVIARSSSQGGGAYYDYHQLVVSLSFLCRIDLDYNYTTIDIIEWLI